MPKNRLVKRIEEGIKRILYPLLILNIIIDEGGKAYGYMIAKKFSELTGTRLVESTLYPTLKELEKMGLVKSYWGESPSGPPRKYYIATEKAPIELKKACYNLKILLDMLAKICKD